MTVQKVGFVGIRSDRLQETVALFRDVIGVPVTRQTNDLVGFRLADGTVLEPDRATSSMHFSQQVRSSHFEWTILMKRAARCLRLASCSLETFNTPTASAGSIFVAPTAPCWKSAALGLNHQANRCCGRNDARSGMDCVSYLSRIGFVARPTTDTIFTVHSSMWSACGP